MTWQSTLQTARRSLHRFILNRRMPVDPFFTLSLDLCCITSIDGRFRRINPAVTATLGHAEPVILASNILDLLHPDDRPRAASAIAALATGTPIAGLESRFRCDTGCYKWLVWSTTPFPAAGLAYTVAHDRTRRKQDEHALIQSENRCVCAVENSMDAFFAVDSEWHIIAMNHQAERLWMRDRLDLLGQDLWKVFPEPADGPFYRLFQQVMCTGSPAQIEAFYPHASLDRWFEVRAYRSPEGLAVYLRDVTERHVANEKIDRTLQENEVLLREVHHRVKNNLQVICSMLRLQERNFGDETLLQALRECRERVMAMAMLHDQLHRAKDFSNINLGEYIRNLAASLFCSYGVNSAEIALRMEIADIPVAVDTAIPCGLIVNELVSNSLRHAFPSNRNGQVSLGLQALGGGSVELTIADDGQGIPKPAVPTRTRSLGLWLVDLLAEQIDAIVERSNGIGTHYRLVFRAAAQADKPVSEH